eukprot:748199-Hanusia_phi.AAC.2
MSKDVSTPAHTLTVHSHIFLLFLFPPPSSDRAASHSTTEWYWNQAQPVDSTTESRFTRHAGDPKGSLWKRIASMVKRG